VHLTHQFKRSADGAVLPAIVIRMDLQQEEFWFS